MMIHPARHYLHIGLLTGIAVVLGCGTPQKDSSGLTRDEVKVLTVSIANDLPWSERMAMSIMKRAPEAYMNDFQEEPSWNYTLGLVLASMQKVSKERSNAVYARYASGYGDTMILADGGIRDYDQSEFNIDHVAPGPFLFEMWHQTKEQRYLTAIQTLMHQLEWQPQTTDGGYWHKLRYPWQMWLDGLFMGEPFQAQYAREFDRPDLFEHIARQFVLAEQHTRDPETGLLYHGWDESRIQRWADPETGCSPHFWSRAIGWYCMGLVDVLDYFPQDHPQRAELIAILDRTIAAVVKYQDPESSTWWQILDQPDREGNYLESTGSCMFTYAMIKGVNKGYLDASYGKVAQKSFQGILNTFIKVDNDGEIHLTNCCSVAGLGGRPYRDGSFEYYVSEPVRDDDPKGVAPFMLACLEFERHAKTQ